MDLLAKLLCKNTEPSETDEELDALKFDFLEQYSNGPEATKDKWLHESNVIQFDNGTGIEPQLLEIINDLNELGIQSKNGRSAYKTNDNKDSQEDDLLELMDS